MNPIVLFLEDHRDPIAKQILSLHLSHLNEIGISAIGLEIDHETSLEQYLTELMKHLKDGLTLANLIKHFPQCQNPDIIHIISQMSARKAEIELIVRSKSISPPIMLSGFDLNLKQIRYMPVSVKNEICFERQEERENKMAENLHELGSENGIVAILGASHYKVAQKLQDLGHEVFVFVPFSEIYNESYMSSFLKILKENPTHEEFKILDATEKSIDELWQTIVSTVQKQLTVSSGPSF